MPAPGPLDGHVSRGRGADNSHCAVFNSKKRQAEFGGESRDEAARTRLQLKRLERIIAKEGTNIEALKSAAMCCFALDWDEKALKYLLRCVQAGAPGDPLGACDQLVAYATVNGDWRTAQKAIKSAFGGRACCLSLYHSALHEVVKLAELRSRLPAPAAREASTTKAHAALAAACGQNPKVAVLVTWPQYFAEILALEIDSASPGEGTLEEALTFCQTHMEWWTAWHKAAQVRTILAELLLSKKGLSVLYTSLAQWQAGCSDESCTAFFQSLSDVPGWPKQPPSFEDVAEDALNSDGDKQEHEDGDGDVASSDAEHAGLSKQQLKNRRKREKLKKRKEEVRKH